MVENMGALEVMVTELYNKLVLKPNKPKIPRKMTLREYFINSYVKEGIYTEFTPFKMNDDYSINDVQKLAAEITFKLLKPKEKLDIEEAYNNMTSEQLEHLKNM